MNKHILEEKWLIKGYTAEDIEGKKSIFIKKHMETMFNSLMEKNNEVKEGRKEVQKSFKKWNDLHEDILEGKANVREILTFISV